MTDLVQRVEAYPGFPLGGSYTLDKNDAAENLGEWIMEKLRYAMKSSLIPDFVVNVSGVIAWSCTEILPAEILSNVIIAGVVSNDDSLSSDRRVNPNPSCNFDGSSTKVAGTEF
ncbi:hypothetical protein BCON_0204g00070 [Botryotinia convoluta]|uniref:Uncharacterized protein n=1 Tax=Botryotinia convoluta TaxID=54673 RepID=A0A4Z1HKN9_9HELO|nr:hypothetical protein BCON_0204g00070 [Botryotinia convoluta]